MPCPRCGYDLRASAVGAGGVRCPECGKITALAGDGGITASRVPWTQRRWRGRVRMFFATVGMVVFRPGMLAREVEVPARMRDARRFHTTCLVLAMLTGCAFIVGAIAAWANTFARPVQDSLALAPAVVLLDQWFGVLPLALGTLVATWVCVTLYRRMVMLGGGSGWRGEPRFEARRLAALSYYTAALWVVEGMLVGWMAMAALAWIDGARRPGGNSRFSATMTLLAGTAAVAVYFWTSLGVVLRTGRWRGLRATLIGLYAAVAPALWLVVLLAFNWAVGYVVLGVASMIEQ
jgi:hypothetical protein